MIETVYEQFRDAALEAPDRIFLCYPASETRGYEAAGAEYSYGGALALVDDLAAAYRTAGYRRGHRVALVLGNRSEHFWHLLALNANGVSAVLLNPDYLDHELAFGIEFADSALAVGAPPYLDRLASVVGKLETAVALFDASVGAGPIPAPSRGPAADATTAARQEAMVIYTSGTTGNPKGCMISNASCLASGEFYGEAGGLMEFRHGGDRLYVPFPTFHMSVSVFTLNAVTRKRNCLIMQDRFHASSWWSDIVATRATVVHYMGIIPPLLLKMPPSELETQHTIRFAQGAGVDPVVREAFESRFGFPLIEGWGMTETSRAIHNCSNPRCLEDRAFGRPRLPLEVRVADEQDRVVSFGTPGELQLRSSGPDPRHGFFSGYIKQPEETEKAWRNGWFHTGDVVTQREDGMLFFVERQKNIIRRSGENISAAAIENALIENPSVHSVAVIAVPDEFHDEEIMACILPAAGMARSMASAEAIIDRARSRLAHYKLPGWIAFLDEIPVTGTQKVRKGLLFPEGQDPRKDPRSHDLRALKRRSPDKPQAATASGMKV